MYPAATVPDWMMLERFIFRRDDEDYFPDGSKAPIVAHGITFWGAEFRVAFSLAEPPFISHIYAQLQSFPPPDKQVPLAVLASHRNLVLLRVGMQTPTFDLRQEFFIYNACATDNPSWLKALPPCTEPIMDCTRLDGRLPRHPPHEKKMRLLAVRSMGLVSRCEQKEEFAVVELKLHKPNRSTVYADICLLRSRTSANDGPGVLGGKWNSMRLSIIPVDSKPDDSWQLCLWQTDIVIPFDDRLCWIDYFRGILICDVFCEPTPTVSFLRFPLEELPSTHNRSKACSWFYRGVTAIHNGRELRFVSVARDDGVGYGALKSGAGFTVTCHTLKFGCKDWYKDYEFTSADLWSANPSLPRAILMFPQVDINMPHVVHFLIIDFKYVLKKMWMVTIDMNTMGVRSLYPYINGREDRETECFDLTKQKSDLPLSFLPSEFTRFLRLSRKRKDME